MDNLQYCKNLLLGIMLFYCAYKDFKYQKISLSIVGITFVGIVILSFIGKEFILFNTIGGFAIGLLLMLISKITRGQIGMGDGIIFSITGFGFGFWNNLYLLLYSLTFCAITAIILIILKKINRKKTIPFIPFVFFSYLGIMLW